MLNHVILMGRIHKVSELLKTESGLYYAHLVVDVERSFRNAEKEYEHDYVQLTLMRGIAKEVLAHCKVGDIVGAKARLQTTSHDDKNHYDYDIIVEKISFLTEDDINESKI